jgi:hypothetical protein
MDDNGCDLTGKYGVFLSGKRKLPLCRACIMLPIKTTRRQDGQRADKYIFPDSSAAEQEHQCSQKDGTEHPVP